MKLIVRLGFVAAVAASSLALSSCGGCCTGEDPIPPLRPMPHFDSPAPVVEYYGK